MSISNEYEGGPYDPSGEPVFDRPRKRIGVYNSDTNQFIAFPGLILKPGMRVEGHKVTAPNGTTAIINPTTNDETVLNDSAESYGAWKALDDAGLIDDQETAPAIDSLDTLKSKAVKLVRGWKEAAEATGYVHEDGNAYFIKDEDQLQFTKLESAMNAIEKAELPETDQDVFDMTGTQRTYEWSAMWRLIALYSLHVASVLRADIGTRKTIEAATNEAQINDALALLGLSI